MRFKKKLPHKGWPWPPGRLGDGLGLELQDLAAPLRRVGGEALFGEDQMADLPLGREHIRLLHIIREHMKVFQIDNIRIWGIKYVDIIGKYRIGEGLRICVPCDSVVRIL